MSLSSYDIWKLSSPEEEAEAEEIAAERRAWKAEEAEYLAELRAEREES